MLDLDKYTETQVIWLIDKAQDDEFWRCNILSVPTLRKQADRLRLKFGGVKAAPKVAEQSWMRRGMEA